MKTIAKLKDGRALFGVDWVITRNTVGVYPERIWCILFGHRPKVEEWENEIITVVCERCDEENWGYLR